MRVLRHPELTVSPTPIDMPVLEHTALTGRSNRHVVTLPGSDRQLQPQVVDAFVQMQAAATSAGIDLQIVSAFRDFSRQRAIWNAKFRLERPLRDIAGQIIDGARLDSAARLAAIMRWSAVPGSSRHHWGTDCDVYDRAAARLETVQLVPEEYAVDGPFFRLHVWLQENMHRYGFYQPYHTDRGGVAPEPWHLSHAPSSQNCERLLSLELLLDLLHETARDPAQRIEGYELLIEHIGEWYSRYVMAVDLPPPQISIR